MDGDEYAALLRERIARVHGALAGAQLTKDDEKLIAWMAEWDSPAFDGVVRLLWMARGAGMADA